MFDAEDPADPGSARAALRHAVEHAAHLLPAQRPVESFVHHNTLHAFEDMPFEQAVVRAGEVFGAKAFMPESAYREAHAAARILDRDLDAVLARRVPEAPVAVGGPGLTEREVARRLMLAMPADASGPALTWRLDETSLLKALPAELPREAREALVAAGPPREILPAIWEACADHAEGAVHPAPAAVRPRDRAVADGLADPDLLTHPVLIRWSAAFLDHGQAYWPLHDRDQGFYCVMRDTLGAGGLPLRGWMRPLRKRLRADRAAGFDALASALATLDRLGVAPEDRDAVVERTLLALPGWPGMFVQLTARADLAPGPTRPTDLADFLAVRLLLDEAALAAVRAEDMASPPVDPAGVVAWRLFHGALLLGLGPRAVRRPGALASLCDLLGRYPQVEREKLWHLAYERRYRVGILDGVLAHHARIKDETPPPPRAQVVTCIDDREESLRRHLEELDARWETLGAAGNYGLAVAYVPLGAARPRPLCPAGLVPTHLLREAPADPAAWKAEQARRARKGVAGEAADIGAGTLFRGTLMALSGVAALFPLVARTVAPSLAARSGGHAHGPASTLLIEHDPDHAHDGPQQVGFTVEEMVAIVEGQLRGMGLVKAFAPLVAVLGHGSASMNNPQEAAHDCGACGGGRGGPNARAFAMMANRPDVRAALVARGIVIPDGTWFVGGYHNTADDAVDWYDLDRVPAARKDTLTDLEADMEEARRRDAHERCRRFELAPLDLSTDAALRHVEDRSEDLAQPRPEYGHCTNALCFVGRRIWSRGLFLDRRVFLTSYDPATDPDDAVLERILALVGPVGAGINLEYYFSFVDRDRYGCNTKLPHNITGLLGVMDGHASDLRTGLPWEMVEIHEPVRLLVVIEARPEQLQAILARQPGLAKLVLHRWILVAAFDPEAGRAWFFDDHGFVQHFPESRHLPEVSTSVDWYGGRRDHLAPATITAGRPSGAGEAA